LDSNDTAQQNVYSRESASASISRAAAGIEHFQARLKDDIANRVRVQARLKDDIANRVRVQVRPPIPGRKSLALGDEEMLQEALLKSLQGTNEILQTQIKSLIDAKKKLRNNPYAYDRNDVAEARSAVFAALSALNSTTSLREYGLSKDEELLFPYRSAGRSEFDSIDDPALGPEYVWLLIIGGLELICLPVAWWGFRFLVRFNRFRKNPAALGLLIASGDLVEYLDYELTRSRESEISIPILKDMSGKIKRSSELRMRSLSLPGLTSQYIAYVQQLLEVLPNKLLICIDELDKITDLDSVRSILRQIKGGLYVRGCYYVISMSEDVLEAFGARLSSSRDIFESTFDEIFTPPQQNLWGDSGSGSRPKL
jgi:hypothetical protein